MTHTSKTELTAINNDTKGSNTYEGYIARTTLENVAQPQAKDSAKKKDTHQHDGNDHQQWLNNSLPRYRPDSRTSARIGL